MSRRSKATEARARAGEKQLKWGGAAKMGGRFLLLVLALFQLIGIVQSISAADTLLHGAVLIAIIVFTTRKEMNRIDAGRRN